MVANDVQYQATKAYLDGVEEAIANLDGLRGIPGPNRRRHELDIAALPSQAADLTGEMRAWELLRSGALESFEGGSLPGLTNAMVKARMARGWTQRRLAEELSMAEQQIHNGMRRPATRQPAWHGCTTSRRSAPSCAKLSPLVPTRPDERRGGIIS